MNKWKKHENLFHKKKSSWFMKQKKKEHPKQNKWFCRVKTVQSKIGKRTTGWNRKPNSENSKFPLFSFVIKKTEVWGVTTQNSYNKRIKKKKPLLWRWNHGWRLEVSFGFKLTRDWKKAEGDYWKTTWCILYVWMRDKSILLLGGEEVAFFLECSDFGQTE